MPSLRAVFYVNASSGNGAMVRYQQLTHVYLGHGDSDKPPSYNPTHAMYDKVFCAGPAAIDRYAAHGVDIPRSKFEIVGRPQVESVRPADGSGAIRTVLYAPTWRGHVSETLLYSLPQGEAIIRALLARGLTVIFRAHPFSHEFPEDAVVVRRIEALLAADAAASGRTHLYGAAAETERSIVECINTSDAMVSDVSSVVSDYLFSGKPFALVAVPSPPEQFVRDFPVAQGSYVVDAQLTNLGEALDLMLGDDPRQKQRAAIRDYYLGDFAAEGYAQNFVDGCLRVLDTPLGEAGGVDDSMDDSRGRSSGVFGRARAQISRYGREVVLSGLGTASAILAFLGAQLPAVLFGMAAVAALLVVSRGAIRDRTQLDRMVGTLVLSRSMVLAAAIACLISDPSTPATTVTGVVAMAALTVATVAGLALRPVWTGPGLGVRSLPGLSEPLYPKTPPGLAYVANLAAVTLAWLIIALSLPAALLLLPGLIALGVTTALVVVSLRRAEDLDQGRLELEQRIAAYEPRFAVYFGSSVGADYQVGMWLPYFHRIGERFVIITRTLGALNAIHEMDRTVPGHLPADPAKPRGGDRADADDHVLRQQRGPQHALHRAARADARLAESRRLREAGVLQPGPRHLRQDLRGRTGRHRPLRPARRRHRSQQVRDRRTPAGGADHVGLEVRSARLEDVTVLYAPTWRGPYADSRVYSLPMGERIVRGLLDRGVRVVFRAHPFNYRFPGGRRGHPAHRSDARPGPQGDRA